MIQSINPATGAVIGNYNQTTKEEVDAALVTAQQAFAEWRRQPFEHRSEVLHRIAAIIRTRKEDLARLATAEMGKPIQQSRDEVEKCARTFDFYADEGPKMLADDLVKTDAHKSYVH